MGISTKKRLSPADNAPLNVEDCISGFGLPRRFYTSTGIYENDIKNYWNCSWIWVGHITQVSKPGDFFVFDYSQESVIISRDREGQVNAFMNVCRHRGSRVCTEKSGSTRVFSCPYHAWTYELDGQLRSAREMGPEFDRRDYRLRQLHLRIFQGLIFVCAGDAPPDIEAGLQDIAPLIAPFNIENTKIAHHASYLVSANWKLAIENYMECYHCGPAHAEYSLSHSLKDPKSITPELISEMHRAGEIAGLPIQDFALNGSDVDMHFFCQRYPLYPGYVTGSKTGAPLAPLLGELKSYDGGTTDIQIGILNNFLAYSDHMIGYRFIPISLQETNIEVIWFVQKDALEGKDYIIEDLTWLWHVTSQDDEQIISLNQKGINSHYFTPGPLSEMEWGIRAFYQNYLRMV
ncbi:MAG: aromatic ring-hydroxylating dioxygenase subunit alpha [Paracoccaceae bacterium]|nr:aromatic ring-hydroxylating dioxygenase subunit alpha [Paracoccaceae bacterium]